MRGGFLHHWTEPPLALKARLALDQSQMRRTRRWIYHTLVLYFSFIGLNVWLAEQRQGQGLFGLGVHHFLIMGGVGVLVYGPALFLSALRGRQVRVSQWGIVAYDEAISRFRIRGFRIRTEPFDGEPLHLLILTLHNDMTRIYGIGPDIDLEVLYRDLKRLGMPGRLENDSVPA